VCGSRSSSLVSCRVQVRSAGGFARDQIISGSEVTWKIGSTDSRAVDQLPYWAGDRAEVGDIVGFSF
jgi:hypothetical protein